MTANGAALAVARSGQGVALTQPVSSLPSPEELKTLQQLGQMYIDSGLLPAKVKTWQAALILMQTGRELGIPPLYAARKIDIINGAPTASAELIGLLIYRDHGTNALRWVETTNEVATLEYRRRGWDKAERYTYTIADARMARLADKENWQKTPAAMLRARCLSAVGHMTYQDSIGGLYVHEEMPDDDTPPSPLVPTTVTEARLPVAATEIIDIETGEISNVATGGEAATARQLKFIEALGRDLGMTNDLLDAEAERTLRTNVRYLGRADASTFIEHLNTLKKARDDGSDAQRGTQAQQSASNDKDHRLIALARLHAVGMDDDRNLDHDALHRLAFERFGVESLKALVQDDLTHLIGWVERLDAAGWKVHASFIGKIAKAREVADRATGLAILRTVKDELYSVGLLGDRDLRAICEWTQAHVLTLPMAPTNGTDNAPPTNGQAEFADAPELTGTVGNDRYTN